MAEYVTGLERTQEYIDRLQGVLQFFETLPQENAILFRKPLSV